MKKLPVVVLIDFFLLISCINENIIPVIKFTGEAQGTYYAVTYFDTNGRNFQSEIDSLLNAFDQSVSVWVPNSVISKVNRNDTLVELDFYFTDIFNLSKEIHSNTTGAFDPTVGPLVNAWGFGFTDRMKVDQNVVDSLLPLVNFHKVKIAENKVIKEDSRIQFDFNAIAQGYSVDLVGKLLESKGIENYLIDIGGEVLAKGKKPNGDLWEVGIEKPKDNASYGEGLQAIVKLENKALATSGNYRKFYEVNGIRYSHTIDPKTGYPVQHSLLSVSVLADECATADAYATALMVLGLEKSKTLLNEFKHPDAYFIYSDEHGNLKTFFTREFTDILVE
ncbi:MAG: FAD:protein FMN transferase [Bacteroidetes bacterium]|nr:FAD:protein FMN transferase [Bacteroidota bacterium]MBL7102771.1 FAD:protein FMN transferase [Bacteroidales bacterium]